jgi:predicted acylesterase/phospholipase RssA
VAGGDFEVNEASAQARVAHSTTFQILSFDGGGLKGLFPAAVLAAIEDDLGVSIANHFDLIVGNSTGGLIALGLGAGLTPREIVDFYVTKGPTIFGSGRRIGRAWRSKHEPERLRAALVEVFGDRRLGSSTKRLVVPSYSLDGNDVYVFKTPHHDRLRRDHKELIIDVAMATTAAPLFLPVFRLGNNRLIDGGVWANNPTLVAVAEAKSMLNIPLDAMRILSMGTTDECVNLGDRLNRGGLLQWARPASTVLLRGQAIGSFHALSISSAPRTSPASTPRFRSACSGSTASTPVGSVASPRTSPAPHRPRSNASPTTRRPHTPQCTRRPAMAESASELVAELLTNTVSDRDIPAELQAAAETLYQDVGLWFGDHLDSEEEWTIYPQGSQLLGTAVRPYGKDDFDLDAVALCNVDKDAITQAELKGTVGGGLIGYVDAHAGDEKAPTDCEEGRRCWTLVGDHLGFHMDFLPSIPDPAAPPTGILLSDTELFRWQFSNPIAFANWFHGRSYTEYMERRRC